MCQCTESMQYQAREHNISDFIISTNLRCINIPRSYSIFSAQSSVQELCCEGCKVKPAWEQEPGGLVDVPQSGDPTIIPDLLHQVPQVISEINNSKLLHFHNRLFLKDKVNWKGGIACHGSCSPLEGGGWLLEIQVHTIQKLFISADCSTHAWNNVHNFSENKCQQHELSWHLQFLESSIFNTVFRRLLWDLAREQKQQHSWDVCKLQYVVQVLVESTAVPRIKVQREKTHTQTHSHDAQKFQPFNEEPKSSVSGSSTNFTIYNNRMSTIFRGHL